MGRTLLIEVSLVLQILKGFNRIKGKRNCRPA